MTGSLVSRWLGRLVWPDLPADLPGTVVVCHEWLVTVGGSDKVAAEIVSAIDADFLVVITASPELVSRLGITTPLVESRLGKHVRTGRRWQWLLPVMPLIWSSLDLRRCRLVVTSSHAFVNCVRGPAGAKVSYCHTPMRYAWDWRGEAGRLSERTRWMWPVVASVLRAVDRLASRSVSGYIANSANVRRRIGKYYQREAIVVHPPIDLEWWTPGRQPRDGYVLVAGRMVAYKRPEVAVEAARRAGCRVVLAGSGPVLDTVAPGADLTIVESPTDERLRELYRECSVLAFAAVEDFGMIPIEAQACGAPVVGVAEGGTLETVRDGETGLLAAQQSAEAMAEAIRTIVEAPFEVLPHATERFGRERFVEELRAAIRAIAGARW